MAGSNRKARALTTEEVEKAVRLFDALDAGDAGAIAFEAVDVIVTRRPEYADVAVVATVVLRRALAREGGLIFRFGSWLGSWFKG